MPLPYESIVLSNGLKVINLCISWDIMFEDRSVLLKCSNERSSLYEQKRDFINEEFIYIDHIPVTLIRKRIVLDEKVLLDYEEVKKETNAILVVPRSYNYIPGTYQLITNNKAPINKFRIVEK